MASWIKRTSKKGLGTTRSTTTKNLSTGKTTKSFSSKPSTTTRVTKSNCGNGKTKVTTTQKRSDGSVKKTTRTISAPVLKTPVRSPVVGSSSSIPKITQLKQKSVANKPPKITQLKQKSVANKPPKVWRPKTIKYKKSKPMKFSTILWFILGLLVLSTLFK